ncbi:MAG: tetratricopeptide repeat protein, partial [Planctomycetaceae bacterium]
ELAVCSQAVRKFRGAVQLSPFPWTAHLDSRTAVEFRQLPEAAAGGQSAAGWRDAAERCLARGFIGPALAASQRAWRLDSRSADGGLLLAYSQEQLGLLGPARDLLTEIAGRARGDLASRAWHRLGLVELQRGAEAEAAAAFTQAGDRHWPSVYYRARLLLDSDQPGEAAPLIASLRGALRNDLHVGRLQARLHDRLGQIDARDAAEEELRYARPTFELDGWQDRWRTVRRRVGLQRELSLAFEELRSGRSRDRAVALGRQFLADPLWMHAPPEQQEDLLELVVLASDLDSARQLIERQEKQFLHPSARLWQARGEVSDQAGDLESAYEQLRRAVAIDPNRGQLQTRLAMVAGKLKRTGIEKLARRSSMFVSAFDMLVKRDLDGAGPTFGEIVAEDPDWIAARFYLAETFRLHGDLAEARSAYQKCLELNPRFRPALKALERHFRGTE